MSREEGEPIKKHFIQIIVACIAVCMLFSVTLINAEKHFSAVTTVASTDKFPYTLIIDAGHGGADGGAVSVTGTYESQINLDIALKTEQIAAFCGISPVMTRISEEIIYPDSADTIREKKIADQRQRVQLINTTDNPFYIGIHQNKYTSSGPSGAQTFYGNSNIGADFAEYLQEMIVANIDTDNKRPAAKINDGIYIMKNIVCPSVLVECGFISNKTEAELLENADYQTKLATVIIGSYINFLC